MSQSIQSTSELRQRMIDDMRMRKLCPKTQSSYIRAVRQFAGYLGRSPDTASVEDLRGVTFRRKGAGVFRRNGASFLRGQTGIPAG